MTLSSATLASELGDMDLFDTEAAAISAWADAFAAYFVDAESGTSSTPIIAAAVTGTAKPAMAAAMTGLSTGGAAAIVAGVTAFWGAMVAAPASFFTSATAITTATGIAGLEAALESVFATNTSEGKSKADSMTAIAGALHTGNAGGTVTFPGPTVETIV